MTTMKMAPHAAASEIPLERTGVAAIVIPLSECMTPGPSVNCLPGIFTLASGRPFGQSGGRPPPRRRGSGRAMEPVGHPSRGLF